MKTFPMRVYSLLVILLFISCDAAFAQNARGRNYKAPLAGSGAMKDADDKYNPNIVNLEAPDVEHNVDKKKLRDIKKEVGEKYPRQKKKNPTKKKKAAPPPTE